MFFLFYKIFFREFWSLKSKPSLGLGIQTFWQQKILSTFWSFRGYRKPERHLDKWTYILLIHSIQTDRKKKFLNLPVSSSFQAFIYFLMQRSLCRESSWMKWRAIKIYLCWNKSWVILACKEKLSGYAMGRLYNFILRPPSELRLPSVSMNLMKDSAANPYASRKSKNVNPLI